MISKKEAVLAMLKAAEGTMDAAGFKISSPKNPGEDEGDIEYTGMLGTVTLKQDGKVLSILCKKNAGEAKEVSQVLFDYEDEDWDARASKSVANEISESVAGFYKTQVIYAAADTKKADKSKGDKAKGALETAPAPAKKKNKKDSVVTYEPINLANRLENIYPELKGNIDQNVAKYEIFLAEEYFETLATPLILGSIRTEDRQTLKKVFNAFNIFYDEGDNDVQSLITVSVLGIGFAKEPELYTKCESYMNDDLKDAVTPIMHYLQTSGGKKKVAKFQNPQPFKAKGLKAK